jgi:peptide/nickel transport system substrate-binding protein
MNTRVAPFDDLRARRALNYAIDRRVIVKRNGGADAAHATCQALPPGIPGYEPYCRYTVNPSATGQYSGPDLAKARRLIRASGTHGMRVTLLTDPHTDYPAPSNIVQTWLSCDSFLSRSDSNSNRAGFCDPALDASMDRALELETTDRPEGRESAMGRDRPQDRRRGALVADTEPEHDRLRLRPRGQLPVHPQWGMLLDQLWVK